jgi:hypothetical protein
MLPDTRLPEMPLPLYPVGACCVEPALLCILRLRMLFIGPLE